MTQSLTQETEQRTTQTQRSKFSPALKRRFLQDKTTGEGKTQGFALFAELFINVS